jgi:adenylate cyclase class IV
MASYEVEIKSLLGSSERADELRFALRRVDSTTTLSSQHKQLNHYFVGGDVQMLVKTLAKHLSDDDGKKLADMTARGKDFSVRTRLADEKVLFVMKASLDAGSSHNTVTRMEFEVEISGMTLYELDDLVQRAGFSYQAKWSREREEYVCAGVNVCLDRNAGYGYLAEFEKMVDSEEKLAEARRELDTFMAKVGAEELPQARLERMFAFYNTHWPEYYGTDKIFTVE